MEFRLDNEEFYGNTMEPENRTHYTVNEEGFRHFVMFTFRLTNH